MLCYETNYFLAGSSKFQADKQSSNVELLFFHLGFCTA